MNNEKGNGIKKRKPGALNIALIAAVAMLAGTVIFAGIRLMTRGSEGSSGNSGNSGNSGIEETVSGEAETGDETADSPGQEAGTEKEDNSGQVVDTEKADILGQEAETEKADTPEQGAEPEKADATGQDTGAEKQDALISGNSDAAQVKTEKDTAETNKLAEEIMDSMTLHEKVCQLFMVYPSAITGAKKVTVAGDATRSALEKYPVGGFLYNATNMENAQQLKKMLTGVQEMTFVPLFLACDEEGGRVARLMENIGTTRIDAMYTYKDEGTEKAYENAFTIASDMNSVGMNLDFAPVADVWSNPDNKVIGDRAYSDDFEQAALLVGAAVGGFHDGGVACTLKHFPGHGDTTEDTHVGSAYAYKSIEELRDEEFLPFKAGIDAGADAVMIAHIILEDVSDEPALFSKQIVTGILRGELGFDGVVITDALEMGAIAENYTSGEAVLKCLDAGVDVLLCPEDFYEAVSAIEVALLNGELTEERIDESVRRILRMKIDMGLINGEKS